jgi:hypothetical protein
MADTLTTARHATATTAASQDAETVGDRFELPSGSYEPRGLF